MTKAANPKPVDVDAVVIGAGFPNLFMITGPGSPGGFGEYWRLCQDVAEKGYEGLVIR